MIRHVADRVPRHASPRALSIRRVTDSVEFAKTPHPAIGPLTTPIRHVAFERLRVLLSDPAGRTRGFVAWLDGKPVGAIEIFLGSESAGIHDLRVLERYQRRGIGAALLERACHEAREMGFATLGLLATTEGQALYLRRGFQEVARFACWYRSFQRGS